MAKLNSINSKRPNAGDYLARSGDMLRGVPHRAPQPGTRPDVIPAGETRWAGEDRYSAHQDGGFQGCEQRITMMVIIGQGMFGNESKLEPKNSVRHSRPESDRGQRS